MLLIRQSVNTIFYHKKKLKPLFTVIFYQHKNTRLLNTNVEYFFIYSVQVDYRRGRNHYFVKDFIEARNKQWVNKYFKCSRHSINYSFSFQGLVDKIILGKS